MIDYKFDLTNGKNISLNGIKCPICGTVMKPERIEMKDYNIDYSFQSCSIERNAICETQLVCPNRCGRFVFESNTYI
jgi:hypothetical protein